MTSPVPISESYLEFSRLLRQLHAIIRSGEGDSDEAEVIRDEMDDYYMRLEPEEIERLKLLSSDLNSIGEGPPSIVSPTSVEEIYRKHLAVSREVDPEKIRHFLGSEANDPSWNAFIRFLYWSSLGDLEAARPFAQFILACLEKDIVEVQRGLSAESRDLNQALPASSVSEAEELRQRAEHLRQSEDALQDFTDRLNFVSSRVGRLDEDNHIQTTVSASSRDFEEDPQQIKEALIALISGFSSVPHAA